MAYILGEREFWSMSFSVSPDVLIPRPDSELLVERAVALLRQKGESRILDIGCGSGAVGLAVASELTEGARHSSRPLPEGALRWRGETPKNSV